MKKWSDKKYIMKTLDNLPTIKEVLSVILEVDNNQSANVEFDSSKPTMIPKRLINTDKFKKICDWKPQTSLKEGLKLTIDWYREFYKGNKPEDINDHF